MLFEIILEKRALRDLDKGVEYYNEQQKGLGRRFSKEVNTAFNTLIKNPFFQIRYDDIRCLPLKKFPFMIHFSVDEKQKSVIVFAIIHDSLDPEKNYPRKKN